MIVLLKSDLYKQTRNPDPNPNPGFGPGPGPEPGFRNFGFFGLSSLHDVSDAVAQILGCKSILSQPNICVTASETFM